MRTKSITKSKAKRLLPGRLRRYRHRTEKMSVIRKRDAHDSRLPEEQYRKATKDQLAAAKKARKVMNKKVIAAKNAAIAECEKQAA